MAPVSEKYRLLQARLAAVPETWLVTGVAGFIGCNLLEALLKLDQKVIGLDNFATGYRANLEEIATQVTPRQWENFRFIEGDIRNLEDCRAACKGTNYVLHQAALGSVPRSLDNPRDTNDTNITGFLNMLIAARDAQVKRFVYAASSSTYGDHPDLPRVENRIGNPLSPYSVTKLVNELYAGVFARCYGFQTIGLRYFNIFGRRQNPNGAYAAVIPKWFASLRDGEPVYINGDGHTSRDFCYIDNAVQANLLAAATDNPAALDQVYNVAVGQRATLNELFALVREQVARRNPQAALAEAVYRDFRAADVPHSLADIGKAQTLLGYQPGQTLREGLEIAAEWYLRKG